MDHQSSTRFPSLSYSTQDPQAQQGIVMIDGLDVVDEQVVVLSPLATSAPGLGGDARPRRHRPPRGASGGDGYALG